MQPNPDSASPSSKSPDALTAQMEAEIASAMAELDQAAAAHAAAKASKPAIRGPRVVQAGREQRKGRVVSVGPTDVFVEFGPKNLGVIQRTQYKEDEIPKVGDEIDAVVDHRDDDGVLVCVRPGSVTKAAWESLESGQVVDAKVTGVNKGGLELEVAGHRAFMPASQVAIERIPDLNVYMGEKLTCMVSRVDRAGRGNIVLSRRDVLEQDRKASAEKIKATLAEGQTVEGTVRKIMPFGAFVDIGGIDGLVHISDLSYDRVGFGEKAVAKHIQEGQKVKVQILKLDWENDRISLGLKQVAGDPFATAANSITEGSDVTGRVVRITEFGAFVELAPGVDGLVHISELDHKRVNKVDDVVKTDEILTLRVLKIDPATRRVSLSLKALKPLPEIKFQEGGEFGGGGGGGGGPGARGTGRGREAGSPAGGGGGGGGGGRSGGMGFGGGRGGRGRDRDVPMRSAEEILKETPALRRAREKAHNMKFKGGLG